MQYDFDAENSIEVKKEKILALLGSDIYKPMRLKELFLFMQVPEEERDFFRLVLNLLVEDYQIFVTQKGKYVLPEKSNLIRGIFSGTQRGFGFVVTEGSEDIFIAAKNTNGALHKDEVLFRILETDGFREKRAEGEIVKIIKRGYQELVGTYIRYRKKGFVVPNEKKIGDYILIPNHASLDAVHGHKVVVKITKRGTADDNPEGKIIEIIGHLNDPGVDISSIVRHFEIPVQFDEPIYEELKNIPDEVSEDDWAGRKDLRKMLMITIDGEDSKDLDDAVSLERLTNGNYYLGVHIADVTHYVKENSELDQEARRRGTSVYLVDRVIPMLPHKLSNGICSLNEKVDRLALSCFMEIDPKGTVVDHAIMNSVICVNRRMTYTIVNDLIENMDSEYLDENKEQMPMIWQMKELRDILRQKREKRGAIDFGFPETKIIVDENCYPIEIKAAERNIATGIIEEFMICCNETIAEHFFWLESPFVYRCHEEPDKDRLQELSQFVSNLGYNIRTREIHPRVIQALLARVEGLPEEAVISRVVLRSLKQARYEPENKGHFGLASTHYSHFTSPIRRYPDLQIHRIIKEWLQNTMNEDRLAHYHKTVPEVCKQSSVTERIAELCERETTQLKKVQFMENKIGQVFSGIISGVTSWGLYVELHNTVEGLVSVHDMVDDEYMFDREALRYTGQHTRKVYKLGDRVDIVVQQANVTESTLNFLFVPSVDKKNKKQKKYNNKED